uniref:AP2/ERF domain-containing protein n=1 Tax=Aplanochytrium stocchinoi TaxID=215587 RepID=A0A6S8APM6_9STRA
MLRPLLLCEDSKHSCFYLIGKLESLLWSLANVDARIMHALKNWRWLYGWGTWNWPERRENWRSTLLLLEKGEVDREGIQIPVDLGVGFKSESHEKFSVFDLAASALRTLCRAYISTMPPVHPDCYVRASASKLDAIYEALAWEASTNNSDASNISEYTGNFILNPRNGFRLSQTLDGMPIESDWLRELYQCRTFPQLSLLACWVYTEAVSRFASAIVISNRSKGRLHEYHRNKVRYNTIRRLRKERLADTDTWLDLFNQQRQAQKEVYPELFCEKSEVEENPSGLATVSEPKQETPVPLQRTDEIVNESGSVVPTTLKLSTRQSNVNLTTNDEGYLEGNLAGISEVRNRYKAELRCNDGCLRLVGRYDTAIQAALAHDSAARSHYEIKEAEKITNFPFTSVLDLLPGFVLDIKEFYRSLETTTTEKEDQEEKNKSAKRKSLPPLSLPSGKKRGRGRPRKYPRPEGTTLNSDNEEETALRSDDKNKEGAPSRGHGRSRNYYRPEGKTATALNSDKEDVILISDNENEDVTSEEIKSTLDEIIEQESKNDVGSSGTKAKDEVINVATKSGSSDVVESTRTEVEAKDDVISVEKGNELSNVLESTQTKVEAKDDITSVEKGNESTQNKVEPKDGVISVGKGNESSDVVGSTQTDIRAKGNAITVAQENHSKNVVKSTETEVETKDDAISVTKENESKTFVELTQTQAEASVDVISVSKENEPEHENK